ncbi:MAG: 3-dehydroquinate synthase [Anaerolineae bacterium]
MLTGFMGTGKTTLGRAVADRLGRSFVDMDDLIEARAGKSIARIFEEDGESSFRDLESQLCRELAEQDGLVVATGGGALVDPVNRAVMSRKAVVVCLQAEVDEILRRVGDGEERPLLRNANPRRDVEHLLAARQRAYASIPWQLPTTDRSTDELVSDLMRLSTVQSLRVSYPDGHYDIHIGSGILSYLGGALRAAGVGASSRIALISNDIVAPLYAESVTQALNAFGFDTKLCVLPDGEVHKTLSTVHQLYGQLLRADLDRSGTVLALGGGVTGDIAGFAAATYMRGVRFVQIPTSLLAMTDASVGAKTGVNLSQGKNLVGAFKQPALVFIDLDVLRTLPEVELRSGMAEVIKHAVIADASLLEDLVAMGSAEAADITPELLARSIEVKIKVVEDDPFEEGRRAILNFGHTVGHALERLTDYRLRHGEAVAIGMIAASQVSVALGRASPEVTELVEAALKVAGLPVKSPSLPVEDVIEAMRYDKKRKAKRLRWVLPRAIGEMEITTEVPLGVVRAVLTEMGARG